MLPDFQSTFRTIESYRYSITVGLFLLFLAPFVLPIGWGGASSTWQFAAGLMFFLSFGMIITRDVWPLIRRMMGWSLSEEERAAAAMRVIEEAKRQNEEEGQEPPFRITVEDERIKEFITYNFEAASCRIEGDEVVVTRAGLQQLRKHI